MVAGCDQVGRSESPAPLPSGERPVPVGGGADEGERGFRAAAAALAMARVLILPDTCVSSPQKGLSPIPGLAT